MKRKKKGEGGVIPTGSLTYLSKLTKNANYQVISVFFDAKNPKLFIKFQTFGAQFGAIFFLSFLGH